MTTGTISKQELATVIEAYNDVTERPETLECGSNILAGSDPELIEAAITELEVQRDALRVSL